MSTNTRAGLGDPYWYEWSIGQSYVVQMLDPGSSIVSVTLQKSGDKGLDDVVVRFVGGDARFIQVKHSRVGDSLTFGDLVTASDGESALLNTTAAALASARGCVTIAAGSTDIAGASDRASA